MESRRGVAPRRTGFADRGVRWLPRGTKWSGVWVPPPLRRVHGPECSYYTNTWIGASTPTCTALDGLQNRRVALYALEAKLVRRAGVAPASLAHRASAFGRV